MFGRLSGCNSRKRSRRVLPRAAGHDAPLCSAAVPMRCVMLDACYSLGNLFHQTEEKLPTPDSGLAQLMLLPSSRNRSLLVGGDGRTRTLWLHAAPARVGNVSSDPRVCVAHFGHCACSMSAPLAARSNRPDPPPIVVQALRRPPSPAPPSPQPPRHPQQTPPPPQPPRKPAVHPELGRGVRAPPPSSDAFHGGARGSAQSVGEGPARALWLQAPPANVGNVSDPRLLT